MHTSIAARLSTLVLAAALTACQDAPPTAPTADAIAVLASAGATPERGLDAFVVDIPDWQLYCMTERIAFYIEVPLRFHFTTLPSGETRWTAQIVPGGATGTVWGLTTGTVWTLQRLNASEISHGGANGMYMWNSSEEWRSADGGSLKLNSRYRILQNASGDMVLEHDVFRCTQS